MTRQDKEFLQLLTAGQNKLMDLQFAEVHKRLDLLNGKTFKNEEKIGLLEIEVAKGLPHTISLCPQVPVIEKINIDIAKIKEGKIAERTLRDRMRSNWGLILIGIGIIVTLTIGIINLGKNSRQITNQLQIETNQQTIRDEVRQVMKDDSTYMHNEQFSKIPHK